MQDRVCMLVQGTGPATSMAAKNIQFAGPTAAPRRQREHWGAITKSNYSGLRFREPVYRTRRELAMSYFEHYYNKAGEKTLCVDFPGRST